MKKWIFFCYALALNVGTFLLMSLEIKIWNLQGNPYCLADCLVSAGNSWIFGLFHLFLAMLFMVGTQIETMNVSFAVCFRKRSAIWKWQIYNSVKYAVGTGTLFAIAALVSGSLQSTEIFNWGETVSVFFEKTETTYSGGFAGVWMLFWFWCIWKTLFWLLLLNLTRIWKSRGYICCGFLIALICIEWGGEPVRLFFSVFHIGYFIMKSKIYISAAVLGAGILLAGILWLGKNVMERQEFL